MNDLPKPPRPTPPPLPDGFPQFVALPGDDYPDAVVREIDGQLVLDDPAARGVIAAVESHNKKIAKKNCLETFKANADRVQHFKGRVAALGKSPADVVVVLINVDDVHGRDLSESLMPGQQAMWQQFRDQGQVPFARGLAERQSIQKCVGLIDPQVGEVMKGIKGLVAVVIDHGTAEVFEV